MLIRLAFRLLIQRFIILFLKLRDVTMIYDMHLSSLERFEIMDSLGSVRYHNV